MMSWVPYAATAVILVVVGAVAARATDTGPWYRNLNKPRWNPPDWMFPVVWTTIYALIILSVGRVWNQSGDVDKPMLLLVIASNFVLNMIWSVLFFALKKPLLALFEIVLLWLSIVAMIAIFTSIDAFSGLLLIPYLSWVSVASLLNFRIITLNPGLSR